jgi:hypothetical protein
MNQPDLRQQYALPVFGITFVDAPEGREVVLLFSATVDGQRREVALLHAPIELFGLPSRDVCELEEMPEGPFQLPDFLVPAIRSAIESTVPPDTAIWIEFTEPSGVLTAAPWEMLFAPFGRPVLRLPAQSIMPQTPSNSLDAVICFSSPMAKELLPEQLVQMFIEQIPPDLARVVTFHLFADAAVQPLLQSIRSRFSDEFGIKIYDPGQALEMRRSPTRENISDSIENPWLLWMRDSLRGQTADVVHFLCHGYVRRGHGGLALAESPVRNVARNYATFIFAGELSAFLNDVGAWSAAFTSPPGNQSPAGLRLLQYDLAQLRPGPVLLHDMERAAPSDLGKTYRFLYTPEPQPPVLSPGISLYVHPHKTISATLETDESSTRILHDYTLTGKIRTVKQSQWVASSQRILEQAAIRLNSASETSSDEVQLGAGTALRWVADLIAKHAAADEKADEKKEKS